ncbi:MAG TPA: Crp/Fnr family transcriptional regulator [Pyrinomonadaceae bacterium]
MRSTNHTGLLDHFFDSKLSSNQLLAGLSPETAEAFEAVKQTISYPKGSIIFAEGEEPQGVYLLSQGKAKLVLDRDRKRERIVRIAGPGEVLGLSATISGEPYEVSVETLARSHIDFISRADFLHLLQDYSEICFRAVQLLGQNLHVSYEQFRHFDQTPSAAAKLARLLLSWCEEAGGQTNGEAHLRLPLTHEGIAHMIGTSRETVTRTFGKFRNRNIIRLEGSQLSIRNKAELENFIKPDSQAYLTH